MSGIQLVAALGSSFAAGPNIDPVADVVAMRSARNYPHQLAGRLGARLVDLTVSGATTADVLDTPQQMTPGFCSSLAATPFSADELAQFLTIQDAIARVFGDSAERTGADLVRASVLSAGHALGSAMPWVQPFHHSLERTAGSFHPTEDGMTAIAVELERLLTAGAGTAPAG